ncbi:MAG: 16S rRNA (uracil(1498)-N(3))-methyltransferase [Burkholderiaceae bacterium]|jgi:16S rRNA (uracil1498-N3)-methyltransferase
MPRFFVDVSLQLGQTVTLTSGAQHHALSVLRLKHGDAVTLFNGLGGEFHGQLQRGSGREVHVALHSFDAREAELPYPIVLAQGLPSGDKMDWIVEKAAELGAQVVQPLALARSVVRLSGERERRRVVHWQGVAVSACEQCGRNQVLKVREPLTLRAWLDQIAAAGQRLYANPGAKAALAELAAPASGVQVYLAIGPEGGFSEEEAEALESAGFAAVSLGSRVLRTETAGLAALAMLGALWTRSKAPSSAPTGDGASA